MVTRNTVPSPPPAKPTLFLHIGFPKTGSTSIQAFLNRNRHALEKKGIFYPEPLVGPRLVGHEGHLSMSRCDALLRFDTKSWEQYSEEYHIAIENAHAPVNILSMESGCVEGTDIFLPYLNTHNIKIIVYFRSFFPFYSSLIKAIAKEYYRQDLFNFFTIQDYATPTFLENIESYISDFSIENCIFKNYDKLAKENMLIPDFMQTVGIPHDPDIHFFSNDNVSPSDVVTMFLYQLSFLPIPYASAMRLRDEVLCANVSAYRDFRCTLLPPHVFDLSEDMLEKIRRQGELLQSPEWFEYTMAQKEKYANIGNQDLPPEAQHHIFAQLSEESRTALITAYPQAAEAKAGQPLLPSMENIPKKYFNILVKLREYFTVDHKENVRFAELTQQKEAIIATLAETLQHKEIELIQQADALQQKETILSAQAKNIQQKDVIIATQAETLQLKEIELIHKVDTLQQKETILSDQSKNIHQKDALLSIQFDTIQQKNDIISAKDEVLIQKDVLFSAQTDRRIAYILKKTSYAPSIWRYIFDSIMMCYSSKAREIYHIRQAGLFDCAYYTFCHPDVAAAGVAPITHYVLHGTQEGRDPTPWFNTTLYLQNNSDVAHAGVNPFYHYILFGAREGRQPL